MRILCERHVPPRYVQALASEAWTTVDTTESFFPPTAPDEKIASFAAREGWVVLTRDTDFFSLAQRYEVGVLFLDVRRRPPPKDVVAAIDHIDSVYSDESEIVQSIPGDWV